MREEEQEYAEFTGGRTGRPFFGVLVSKYAGGFSYSEEAVRRYCELKSIDFDTYTDPKGYDIPRTDPVMIDVVQELGSKRASSGASNIVIEIVPWKYRKHYEIRESSGHEVIELDVSGLKLARLKHLMRPPPAELGQDPRYVRNLKAAAMKIIDDDEYDRYDSELLSDIGTAAAMH